MNASLNSVQYRTKVLIVDDSLALCKFLQKVLSADPHLDVVGYALDAYEARDKIKQYNPDVLTLDVEMPRMDGLTFLRNLMRLRPMPVVMISSLTAAGAEVTLDALSAGAVDFMVKRHPGSEEDLATYCRDIVSRVRNAGNIKLRPPTSPVVKKSLPDLSAAHQKLRTGKTVNGTLNRIIAVGSSTGGPEALRRVLEELEPSRCSLVIAQHMPDRYMEAFAARLNTWSGFDIAIAKQGEKLMPGKGYVAPGDEHLEIANHSGSPHCVIRSSDAVNGHRPSVDVLFNSLAASSGCSSVGVLLTGMGNDGAAGLTRMRSAGALTMIQDEKSSAVWGMPGRAFEMGGADSTLPLQHIAPALNVLLQDLT